jgi:hypothetical protein
MFLADYRALKTCTAMHAVFKWEKPCAVPTQPIQKNFYQHAPETSITSAIQVRLEAKNYSLLLFLG